MPFKDEETRKTKQREYSRKWYINNKEKKLIKSNIKRSNNKKKWLEYRSKQVCVNCGFSHPAVIDFHHVIRQNKRSVTHLAIRQNNIPAAIKEAEEKCIPLCCNCHRVLHFEERKGIKAKRKKK